MPEGVFDEVGLHAGGNHRAPPPEDGRHRQGAGLARSGSGRRRPPTGRARRPPGAGRPGRARGARRRARLPPSPRRPHWCRRGPGRAGPRGHAGAPTGPIAGRCRRLPGSGTSACSDRWNGTTPGAREGEGASAGCRTGGGASDAEPLGSGQEGAAEGGHGQTVGHDGGHEAHRGSTAGRHRQVGGPCPCRPWPDRCRRAIARPKTDGARRGRNAGRPSTGRCPDAVA